LVVMGLLLSLPSNFFFFLLGFMVLVGSGYCCVSSNSRLGGGGNCFVKYEGLRGIPMSASHLQRSQGSSWGISVVLQSALSMNLVVGATWWFTWAIVFHAPLLLLCQASWQV
jgi:hypothetical protein